MTREAVAAEGIPGGYAGVYAVLRALEESGRVRRGYFVDGLGAAQFALPGAVDRIRELRDASGETSVHVLGAADPAQPYGAALAWPENAGRPARVSGAYVVLADGNAAAYLERGARTLLTFPAGSEGSWVDAVASLVKDGRLRRIELTRIDGAPVVESPFAEALRTAGFVEGYRGLACEADRSVGRRAAESRADVRHQRDVAHRHVRLVRHRVAPDLDPPTELGHMTRGRREPHGGRRDLDDLARDRALRDLRDPERVRQHELDAAGTGGTHEPALEMHRRAVVERPRPVRVHEVVVADVLERDLFAVAERLGARPLAVALASPGTEQERHLAEVGMELRGRGERIRVRDGLHGRTLSRTHSLPSW